jgi:ABC-type antimicrobial peptide transport system permease subunit
VVLVIVVAFIILNTLLMSVLERTREFGMLLAIGMRPTLIGRMVWLELLLLAGVGAGLGIAIGASVSAWLAMRGVSIPGTEQVLQQYGLPTQLYPSLSLLSLTAGPLAIAGAIAIGGIVPYFHVLRLIAARAMRGA